jgi:uncharacterized protein (DUF433 family)
MRNLPRNFFATEPCKADTLKEAMVDYRKIITIEPGKRGGKPCVRGIRITVGDVLGWLSAGMTHAEIIDDYPDLTEQDILACLAYAADKERNAMIVFSPHEVAV